MLIGSSLTGISLVWGISSAGRAPALQAGGQRFDPAILHHIFLFILYFIYLLCHLVRCVLKRMSLWNLGVDV